MDFGLGVPTFDATSSLPESKHKFYGSGFLKQDRSTTLDDDFRTSKLAKTAIFSDSMSHQQMLSFSSPHQSESLPTTHSSSSLPYFHQTSSNFSRNTGYSYGGLNGGSMIMGRGPFTPSQWMELEHQALIYKYITANVPIPSNLLIPIKKAFDSAGYCSFSGGLLRSNSLGWGSIHLGFSNNSDPEIGRCRRTDGKKWRCSRDAVADQKYCERHMNRGRHRSRKPVEGQTGQSGAGTTTIVPAKMMPVVSEVGASNGIRKSSASNISVASSGLIKENTFLVPKQQIPFGESSIPEFGLINCKTFSSSHDMHEGQTESQHSLRQFIDDWPKSEQTQLSVSIPMASSPDNEKVTLSPLRLAFNPVQMGLGVGNIESESNSRQANWIPISWENSMGGPLGEVLHSTNSNNVADCKNSSALHLMMEGWDNSPRIGSSPTGVLQKTAFGSLSSSAGSSPRAENRSHEGAIMCNDLLGTTLATSSLPAM